MKLSLCPRLAETPVRRLRTAASLAVGAMLTSASIAGAATAPYQHVLILSVDGLRQADLADPSLHQDFSNIEALRQSGITYTNATTSLPSDSFPGALAYLTGAGPATTGVYYDDSYDRKLLPPLALGGGSKPGTETQYAENLDKNNTLLNGGGNSGISSIDPAQLPRDPVTGQPVYPHSFLKVNTTFEVATKAGLHTAFTDKHPAYDLANGPSGKGIGDFFAPEVNSLGAFLDPKNPGKTLVTSSLPSNTDVSKLTMVDPSTDPLGPNDPNLKDLTTSVLTTEKYDDIKVQAVLNQINGMTARGVAVGYTPNLFAMNFQAVSVGEKVVTGGIPTAGNPSADLQSAIAHTDASIGLIVDALKANGEWNNTLLTLTAKHGQNPRIGAAIQVDPATYTNALNAAGISVAMTIQDDSALIWLTDQSQTAKAAAVLQALATGGTDKEIKDVLFGQSLKAAGLGDASANSRTPDLIVSLNPGYGLYLSTKKQAEHGGFTEDDTHVALIVASGGLSAGLDDTTFNGAVDTRQIAVTSLDALGLDPRELEGAVAEGTQALPATGISAVPLPAAVQLFPLGAAVAGFAARRMRKPAR